MRRGRKKQGRIFLCERTNKSRLAWDGAFASSRCLSGLDLRMLYRRMQYFWNSLYVMFWCYEKRLEVFSMITIKLVLQYMGCHHSIVKFKQGFEHWRVWVFCCYYAVLFGCWKYVAISSLFLLNWSGFPPLCNNPINNHYPINKHLTFSFSSNIILW